MFATKKKTNGTGPDALPRDGLVEADVEVVELLAVEAQQLQVLVITLGGGGWRWEGVGGGGRNLGEGVPGVVATQGQTPQPGGGFIETHGYTIPG